MTALALVFALACASTDAPAHAVPQPAPSALDEARIHEAPAVVAGASVAGFVGGTLFALPAVFAVLPTAGPIVALSVGVVVVAAGAAFGAFLGELTYARLAPSGVAATIAALGACVGAVVGGVAAAGVTTSNSPGGALFPTAIGAVVGGAVGAAISGAIGASVGGVAALR